MISRRWLLTLALLGAAPLHAQAVPARLALMPVKVPTGLDSTGAARQLLDSLIGGLLLQAGYLVVPHDSVGPIWDRAEASVGGLFDPTTGQPSEAKYTQADQFLQDTVKARFAPDALIYPRVRVVVVPFRGGSAKWDGIEEKTGARGGLGGAVLGTFQGRLRGLSFVLDVWPLTVGETSGFLAGGGVQLIDHTVKDKLTAMPPESLLIDTLLLQRAARIAVQSLKDTLPPLH